MSKEDFDLFWRTHLVTSSPGELNIPEPSILYWTATKEEASNFPWTRREGTLRSPAALGVARDLMTQIRVATKKNTISVTVLQNYSPTYETAQEILKVLALASEKKVRIDITLTFVALDKIRRPSWVWRGFTSAYNEVGVNESAENVLGLKLLQKSGVRLGVFNTETWKFLYTFLGLGLPSGSPGKYLGGKYCGLSSEARQSEDRLMEQELRQLLKGLHITSPSISPDHSALSLSWLPPVLHSGKVTEYRITGRKITVKFKDAEERLWRIQSVLEGSEFTVAVPGEVTSWKLAGLSRDTFYDVTLEVFVRGTVICSGRKLFKTDDKAPIAIPETPPPRRRKTGVLSKVSASTTSLASSPLPVSPRTSFITSRATVPLDQNDQHLLEDTASIIIGSSSSNSGGTSSRASQEGLTSNPPRRPQRQSVPSMGGAVLGDVRTSVSAKASGGGLRRSNSSLGDRSGPSPASSVGSLVRSVGLKRSQSSVGMVPRSK